MRGIDSSHANENFRRGARLRRWIAMLLLCGLASTAPAVPIAPGQTLPDQRFEWRTGFPSRSAGTYGQYEVTLQAGVDYVVSTSNARGGTTTDPYLYLLNSGLEVVAFDDDSGGNLQSRITFRPAASGNYYIRLRGYQQGRYGFCSLAVTGGGTATGAGPAGSHHLGAVDESANHDNNFFVEQLRGD